MFPAGKSLFPRFQQTKTCFHVSAERKTASTGKSWLLSKKMKENGFHKPENLFLLVKIWSFFKKWLLLISVTVSTSRGKLWTKENGFHKPKNLFPLTGMKDFVEKYFSTRRKRNWQESLRNGKKWFPLAGKSISSSRNKISLAEIFFKYWIFRLISIMVSTSRMKALKSASINQNKANFRWQLSYFLKIGSFII